MKAQTVKKINRFHFFTTFAFVLVFGIVFLVLLAKISQPIPENYVETGATITRIEQTRLPTYDPSDGIGSEDFDFRVLVEYSYGGKTYRDQEYGRYDSSMKEGDTVLLFVNPDDPSDFLSDPSGDFVFRIIGIGLVLIGLGGLGYQLFQIKKEKEKYE